jgi:Flp pilus assembly protein TadG
VATVEFAVLLPVLILIIFGTIEITSRLFLRQSGAIAAYEGVRLAARRTVDAETVRNRCLELLEGRRVTGATIEITPPTTAEVPTGGLIQIRITMPYEGNTPAAFALGDGASMQITASMLRE